MSALFMSTDRQIIIKSDQCNGKWNAESKTINQLIIKKKKYNFKPKKNVKKQTLANLATKLKNCNEVMNL